MAKKLKRKKPKKAKTITKHKQYRDSLGRFAKKPGKLKSGKRKRKLKREDYVYRRSRGRFTLGRKYAGYEIITKEISQIALDRWNGNIKDALEESNLIATLMNRKAKGVDVIVTGVKEARGRRTQVIIKRSFDIANILSRSSIEGLTVGALIRDLHAEGVRTNYAIELVKGWSKLETRKKDAKRYLPLKNIKITAKVYL